MHVSSSSYDMHPPAHMTCMHPPPHMTCMYPPPHMTGAEEAAFERQCCLQRTAGVVGGAG